MLANEIYGIIIYIHTDHSIELYETDNDYPIIHLVKFKSNDNSSIYLPIERDLVSRITNMREIVSIDFHDQRTLDSIRNKTNIEGLVLLSSL